MKIYLFLSFLLSIASVCNAQGTGKSYLNAITYLFHWIDESGDYLNSIHDKHVREEASDKLGYLLNSIDQLYNSQNILLIIISSNDSTKLINERDIWETKAHALIYSLQQIISDLHNIEPLLNTTLHGKADTIAYSIDDFLIKKKGRTLTEIENYLSGNSHVSKQQVLDDGKDGLKILSDCKAKISSIIEKLSVF